MSALEALRDALYTNRLLGYYYYYCWQTFFHH